MSTRALPNFQAGRKKAMRFTNWRKMGRIGFGAIYAKGKPWPFPTKIWKKTIIDRKGSLPYTKSGTAMSKNKLNAVDWDAVAEAERFGALAVSSRGKYRGARMTKYGLTTAQLRVCRQSASHLVQILKRVKRPLHIGKTILELSEQGKKEIVAISGL